METDKKQHKIDYSFKAQVLKSDLYKEYVNARKKDYFERVYYGVVSRANIPNNCDKLFIDKTFEGKQKEFLECEKLVLAKKHRNHHLNHRIEMLFYCGKCYFLTLTFNDKVLKETNQQTRRKYVSRFLKSIPGQQGFVANIDFGLIEDYEDFKGNIRKGTKREHYHCLVCCDYVDLKKWHKYGYINYKLSGRSNEDKTREALYISKLTNHALKDSCKQFRIIYSRLDNIDINLLTKNGYFERKSLNVSVLNENLPID